MWHHRVWIEVFLFFLKRFCLSFLRYFLPIFLQCFLTASFVSKKRLIYVFLNTKNQTPSLMAGSTNITRKDLFKHIPSRKPTYPTMGKRESSSKVPAGMGYVIVPRRVYKDV